MKYSSERATSSSSVAAGEVPVRCPPLVGEADREDLERPFPDEEELVRRIWEWKQQYGDRPDVLSGRRVPEGEALAQQPGELPRPEPAPGGVRREYWLQAQTGLAVDPSGLPFAVHLVLYLFLRFSQVILGVIKESGVTLITRIAGLLLSAIAVQLVVAFAALVTPLGHPVAFPVAGHGHRVDRVHRAAGGPDDFLDRFLGGETSRP